MDMIVAAQVLDIVIVRPAERVRAGVAVGVFPRGDLGASVVIAYTGKQVAGLDQHDGPGGDRSGAEDTIWKVAENRCCEKAMFT